MSGNPAFPAAPEHLAAAEAVWGGIASYLAVMLNENSYASAQLMAARANDKVSVLDALLRTITNGIARFQRDTRGDAAYKLWEDFSAFLRETEPSLALDSPTQLIARVAQAFAPYDIVRQMTTQNLMKFTCGGLREVAMRSFDAARQPAIVESIARRDPKAQARLHDEIIRVCRAYHIELSHKITGTEAVNRSPYADAAAQIEDLRERLQRSENGRAAAEARVAELSGRVARLENIVRQARAAQSEAETRSQTAHSEVSRLRDTSTVLIQRLQKELAARERTVQSNRELITLAQKMTTSVIGANGEVPDGVRRLANSIHEADARTSLTVYPDDSASVRGDRPIGWNAPRPPPARPTPIPERSGAEDDEDDEGNGNGGNKDDRDDGASDGGDGDDGDDGSAGGATAEDFLRGFDADTQVGARTSHAQFVEDMRGN